MFKELSLHGWRQFRRVDIEFHPRLTVLTGANGAGKTTILSLASRHFGWSSAYISTPIARKKDAGLSYSSDFWDDWDDESIPWRSSGIQSGAQTKRIEERGPRQEIGMLSYTNGQRAELSVPVDGTGYSYDIQVANQQGVEGLHIPSHRPVYSYQQVQSIPVVPRRRNDAFQQYIQLIRTRYQGGHTQWTPQYYMKETLIALANFGYGNQAVEADPESAKTFEEFQDVLRRMLPPKLGFIRLKVRTPEIVLETRTGDFSIDALSGGAAAVIDLAWQVFMFQPADKSFVATLDEPENHLHPELQRRILSDLLTAFPTVQFVVATHSPFIVGSVPASNVYVLTYDESNKVVSTLLDTVNKAGSANEILRDVLGLEFTMPVWVEDQLERIVNKFADIDFSNQAMGDLRREMKELGLDRHTAATIARLAEIKDRP